MTGICIEEGCKFKTMQNRMKNTNKCKTGAFQYEIVTNTYYSYFKEAKHSSPVHQNNRFLK